MLQKEEREKQRLIEANKIVILGRWFYTFAVATTGVITKVFGGPNSNWTVFFMFIFGLIYIFINFLFYIYFKYYNKKTIFGIKVVSSLQFSIDGLVMAIVIYFSGGMISGSYIYFFYTLIASAFIYNLFGVTLVATYYSLFYSLLILLTYFGYIPYISRYGNEVDRFIAFDFGSVASNVYSVVTSFYIVGFFSGMIAKSLRKKEEEIIIERDKEGAILADLSDGLIYINKNNIVEMVNYRAEKLLNFEAKEIVNKEISQIDFDKNKILAEILKKQNRSYDLNFSELDTYLKIYTVEIKNEKGGLTGTAKIMHDVSREKYVDKMKSEFITIAGHQLRTPLSAIKGALSLFLSGDYGQINKEQSSMIKQSYDYTEKLIKLVNDMLSISSAEEGKYAYQFNEIDIKNLIETLRERYQEDAQNKKITLRINIEENLPKVELDQNKFKLVINALIENALIYNKENGAVDITIREEDKKMYFIIRDTGIGIPKDLYDKIFTKFFRAENALKHYTEGNGLDLYVAKNIIDNHQGDIWFESKLNEGTTFYIKIPLEQTKKGSV